VGRTVFRKITAQISHSRQKKTSPIFLIRSQHITMQLHNKKSATYLNIIIESAQTETSRQFELFPNQQLSLDSFTALQHMGKGQQLHNMRHH